MGDDTNLSQNLESFFTMQYPVVCLVKKFKAKKIKILIFFSFFFQYELLFCVEDVKDPAVVVVKTLMEKYPNTEAELFIGSSEVGVNPKINNMNPGYEAAKYELFMISDSGIKSKFFLNFFFKVLNFFFVFSERRYLIGYGTTYD